MIALLALVCVAGFVLTGLFAYSLCVVAGRADDQMEEFFREG